MDTYMDSLCLQFDKAALVGDFQSVGQFPLLVTTVDPQKKTEPRKQIHHTSPTMNIKDLLGATKKIYLNTGIQNYVKYLNPYYPARVLADKGKHEYVCFFNIFIVITKNHSTQQFTD
ncbi:hypothetical protein D3C80_1847270 [compost metagenome]